MQQAGACIDKHFRDTALMGFVEVLANLSKVLGFFKECEQHILKFRPDVLILIDYGGFNMRMARFARKAGIKTFYYISPKIWAWNQRRGWKIKASVDKMFVIMPFEKEFYRKFDYEVDYVGNPLMDSIRQFSPDPDFRSKAGIAGHERVIAVLPGSRKQEVTHTLSRMLAIMKHFEDYRFVVAGVDNLPAELYQAARDAGVRVVFGETYQLLHIAEAAVVTSGTATLETALFNVPQVVCYRTSFLSALIAKIVMQVPYISLVNLIAGHEVVKELLQYDFTPARLHTELQAVLGDKRAAILEGYRKMRLKVDIPGSASETAAELMWQCLQKD
jgi:lipid-A-disaccharide synthase